MLNRKLFTALAAAALIGLLGFGLLRLFAVRWEIGDVYPPYSTLRTDPLGARALFESLEAIPGVVVRRNHRPLQQFRPKTPVLLVYAGVSPEAQWGAEELRHFEMLVASGSRAVFAFAPAELQEEKKIGNSIDGDSKETRDEKASAEPEPTKESGNKEQTKDGKDQLTPGSSTVTFEQVAERWGFQFEITKGKRAGSFHGVAKIEDIGAGALESELSWHSALRFTNVQAPWRVLYRVGKEPAVIERPWGDGTIVLAADSFFLSNEALSSERSSQFLAWLIGPLRTVIFDEEHLGVREEMGLVALAQKYRLQGALAALGFVALLWLWRQSVPFVPARSVRDNEEYVAGLDSHAGFTSLLRRAVSPTQTLDVCVAEWRKTFSHDRKRLAQLEQALDEAVYSSQRKPDVVSAYQQITRAMNETSGRSH